MAEDTENVQDQKPASTSPLAGRVTRGRPFVQRRPVVITAAEIAEENARDEAAQAVAETIARIEDERLEDGRAKTAAYLVGLRDKLLEEERRKNMTPAQWAEDLASRVEPRARPIFEGEPLPAGTQAEVQAEITRREAMQFVHDADAAGRTVLEHAAAEAGVSPVLPEGMHDYGKTARQEDEDRKKAASQTQALGEDDRTFAEMEEDETKMSGSSNNAQSNMQQAMNPGGGDFKPKPQDPKVDIGSADFNNQAAEDIRREQELAMAELAKEFEAEERRLTSLIENGTPEEQAAARAELDARQHQYSLAAEKLLGLFSTRSAYRESMLNERATKMAAPGQGGGGGKPSLLNSLRNKKDFQDAYLKFSAKMPTEKERVMQAFRANSNAAALQYQNLIADSNRLQAATERVRVLSEQSTKEFLKTDIGAELDKNLQRLTSRSMSVEDSRDPAKFAARHEDVLAQFAGYKPVEPDLAVAMKGLKTNHAYNMENSTDPDIVRIRDRGDEIKLAADEALSAQQSLQSGLKKIKDSGDTSFDAEPLKKKIEEQIQPNIAEKPFDPSDTKGDLAKKNLKLAEDMQKMVANLINAILRMFGIRTASPSTGATMESGSAPAPAMGM